MTVTAEHAWPAGPASHPSVARPQPLPQPPAGELRILAPRPWEPRYDDEVTDSPATATRTDGALALAWPATPGGSRPQRRLRLVGQPGAVAAAQQEAPPPKQWVGRLVQAVTEVLAGDRPLPQLLPHLTPTVYAGLERAITARPGRGDGRPPAVPAVRSLHLCMPRPGAAEVAAVVRRGERTAALALRLEASGERWRCTALQVG